MESDRRKVYVEVNVTHRPDGTARPNFIKFENDERLKEFVVTIWRDNGVNYGGVERIPYHLLTGQQKNIIQYCSTPRSAREILTHIGYKYHSDTVANVIRPLVSMKYLEYTIPEKPRSKNQKYRKKQR